MVWCSIVERLVGSWPTPSPWFPLSAYETWTINWWMAPILGEMAHWVQASLTTWKPRMRNLTQSPHPNPIGSMYGIYIYIPTFTPKMDQFCRWIFHTWSVWEWERINLSIKSLVIGWISNPPLSRQFVLDDHTRPCMGRKPLWIRKVMKTIWWYTYPPEKYESQWGWWFSIYGKIKNVPNHQPEE